MNASENVYLRTNYTINPNSKEEKKLIDQLPIMKSVRSIVVSIREEELCGTGNLNKCAKQEDVWSHDGLIPVIGWIGIAASIGAKCTRSRDILVASTWELLWNGCNERNVAPVQLVRDRSKLCPLCARTYLSI